MELGVGFTAKAAAIADGSVTTVGLPLSAGWLASGVGTGAGAISGADG